MLNDCMGCIIPVHNEYIKKHQKIDKQKTKCKIRTFDRDVYQYRRDKYILYHYFYALDIETTLHDAINPLQNKHTHQRIQGK